MNKAYLHLVLNHLPITFIIIGFIVMVYACLFKSDMVKRIAYITFIFSALLGFLVFNTGEGTKQLIEGIKGIDERFITIHEEAALAFLALLYILGGLSIVGLWANIQKKSFSKSVVIIVMLFLFIVLFYAVHAGATGGNILHSEIRKINLS